MLELTLPDVFYDLNFLSISVRLLLSMIIGGAIGLERGATKHPAGFRTHILVCVGSAIVMMTNQFLFDNFYIYTGNGDVARLGAQVITGVGFLGAGTIIVAGRQRIKGLTTAAGLWASACIGLATGIGFYSGAIGGAIIIFLSLTILARIEDYFYELSRSMDFYLEVDSVKHMKDVKHFLEDIKSTGIQISVIKSYVPSSNMLAFNITVLLPKGADATLVRHTIEDMEGVIMVEDF